MKIHCPKCQGEIPTRQMNLSADVALCHACDEAFAISRIVRGEVEDPLEREGVADDFDIHQPPPGARFDDLGIGWRVSATLRSGLALFFVPFTLVWSGFSLSGIYGSQLLKGELDLVASLFGIPFLLGTVVLGTVSLMSLLGKVVIAADEMDADQGKVFVGVGPVGWTRRFRWSEVEAIEESLTSWESNNQHHRQITLRREKGDISTGSMLKEARRRYLLQAVRQLVMRDRR